MGPTRVQIPPPPLNQGGLNVSLGAVFANVGLLAVQLAAKMMPKLGFVYPLARRAAPRHVVPTAIAERWFLPDPERERHEERRHAPFPAEEYV